MSFFLAGRTGSVPRWPLAGLRIYAGVVFCAAGISQLMGREAWQVPPHSPLDPPAVVVLELVLGAALGLGLSTRAAALVGVAVMASRLQAHGLSAASLISPGPVTAITMLLLTVALGRAGRVWGLDRRLAARWPGNPLW